MIARMVRALFVFQEPRFIDAVIGGASSMIGSAISGWYNREQAEDNRTFQEHMSSTSYQRAVKDLQAAGLNPMLAYMRGGASTPAGAQGQISSPDVAHSAMAAAKLRAEVENIRSQTDKSRAEAAVAAAMVPKVTAEAAVQNATASQVLQVIKKLQWETKTAESESSIRADDAWIRSSQANWYGGKQPVNRHDPGFVSRDEMEYKKLASELGVNEAQVRRLVSEAVLDELKQVAARNREASDKTWWGRNVRPYLDDAAKLGVSAGQLARGLNNRMFFERSPRRR